VPKCPTCGAEFSSSKLLTIHQRYCGNKDPLTASDAGFNTEKLIRSNIVDTNTEASPPSQQPSTTQSERTDPLGRVPERTNPLAQSGAGGQFEPPNLVSALDHISEEVQQSASLEKMSIYEEAKSKLKLSVKHHEDITLVKVQGDLVVWTSLRLNTGIKKLLATGATKVVLEVSQVDSCDATGLGALILFNQDLKDRNGQLVLCAPLARRERFECVKGFTRAIEFFDTLELAVTALKKA